MDNNYTLRDVSNIADRDFMELMSATFPQEVIPSWFYRPNPALGDETPADLVFEGRDGQLRDYLIKHGVEKLARGYATGQITN